MSNKKDAPIALDPDGFNELRMCRGGPMLYNKYDIYIGGSLAKYGEFSIFEQEVFRQVVQPGAVVVEVGANLGGHTVELSRMVGRDGEVYAFEPQRLVFQALCANLALNQCANVHARQAAVGEAAGSISVPPTDPAVRSNFGGVSLQGSNSGEVVPLIALDSLDLRACRLLKVDVEGMEIEVLKGAQKMIWAHRPRMYIENDRVERSEELLRLVDDLEYDAYWHLPRLYNPENYFGEKENSFGEIVSVNILCMPRELDLPVSGLRLVRSPLEQWNDPTP